MRLEVDGERLFFDVDGAKLRPNGPWLEEVPTVAVVHTGPSADHTPYKDHIGPLLAEAAQVLYLDLRGCGRSDSGERARWNVEQWSSDLRSVFERLHVERPVVLAHGWGCLTALRYAQRWPDALSKLVLVNPIARLVVPRIVASFDQLGGAAAGEAAHNFFEHPSEQTVGTYMRECFWVLVPSITAVDVMVSPLWNFELAVHWVATEGRTLDLRPGLASVTAPTHVFAGTDDPQCPAASIEEVVEGIPGARVQWFEGARHSVFRDAPESNHLIREAALS
jgi:proline iminopeptidase